MWLQLRHKLKTPGPPSEGRKLPPKRKTITLRNPGYPGAACANASIPAAFVSEPASSHSSETHSSTTLLYSEQNATKKMMQELQGSSLSSWGFKRLPGNCALCKRKLCLPEARADPLSICEHLNQNITGVTAFVWQMALLIIITFIDTTSEELNCPENSLCLTEDISRS